MVHEEPFKTFIHCVKIEFLDKNSFADSIFEKIGWFIALYYTHAVQLCCKNFHLRSAYIIHKYINYHTLLGKIRFFVR